MHFSVPFQPLSRLLIALLGVSGGTLLAVEELNFADGGSTESPNTNSPDAFPGSTGKGWTSPWEVHNSPKLTQFNASTADTKPLSQGVPSCLKMEMVTLTSDSSALTGIWRRFSDDPKQDGIDMTQSYEIHCKFRIDDHSEDFSTPRDTITIRGGIWNRSQSKENQPPQWELLYRYSQGWLVRSGDGKSSTRIGPNETVLYRDTVYHIRILISPPIRGFPGGIEQFRWRFLADR